MSHQYGITGDDKFSSHLQECDAELVLRMVAWTRFSPEGNICINVKGSLSLLSHLHGILVKCLLYFDTESGLHI